MLIPWEPPVPGDLRPDVTLAYNSQAVDGLTSTTNSQASWIGDGWDYSPGFIERAYQPCSQNPSGLTKTGDLCWPKYDQVTLSLGGKATTLIQDSSTQTWRAQGDQAARVSYQPGAVGTHAGDSWVVTTTDGTSYYFGASLPSYAAGDTPATRGGRRDVDPLCTGCGLVLVFRLGRVQVLGLAWPAVKLGAAASAPPGHVGALASTAKMPCEGDLPGVSRSSIYDMRA
jgi:hypothetical protein